MSMVEKNDGFSLLELMIAVAIVALLAATAYPSYVSSVQRSGRTDAQAALNNIANAEERFYASNRTYTTDLELLGQPTSNSSAGKYSLTVTAGPSGIETSYVITATPVIGQGQEHDTACPSFSLDSAAQRLPNPATSECW